MVHKQDKVVYDMVRFSLCLIYFFLPVYLLDQGAGSALFATFFKSFYYYSSYIYTAWVVYIYITPVPPVLHTIYPYISLLHRRGCKPILSHVSHAADTCLYLLPLCRGNSSIFTHADFTSDSGISFPFSCYFIYIIRTLPDR